MIQRIFRLRRAHPAREAGRESAPHRVYPSAKHPLAPEPPALQAGAMAGATVLMLGLVWVLLWCVPFLRTGGNIGYHLAGFISVMLLAAWGAGAHRRVAAATLALAIHGLWLGVLVWLWAVHFPTYIGQFWETPMRLTFLPAMVMDGGVLCWLSQRNLRYRHLCRLNRLRAEITGLRRPTATQDELGVPAGWDEGGKG